MGAERTRRTVVVTGASAGIGRACARAFAAGGDDVALLHSEVSEMLEAFRDGGYDDLTLGGPILNGDGQVVGLPKPEGVGSEAADVLIRLLDVCRRRGIDLVTEFERKNAYNRTRGYRHGGKRL